MIADLVVACPGGGSGSDSLQTSSEAAPATANFQFLLSGEDFDTMLVVSEPDCTGAQIKYNDNCSGSNSALILPAMQNQACYIAGSGLRQRGHGGQLCTFYYAKIARQPTQSVLNLVVLGNWPEEEAYKASFGIHVQLHGNRLL